MTWFNKTNYCFNYYKNREWPSMKERIIFKLVLCFILFPLASTNTWYMPFQMRKIFCGLCKLNLLLDFSKQCVCFPECIWRWEIQGFINKTLSIDSCRLFTPTVICAGETCKDKFLRFQGSGVLNQWVTGELWSNP